MLSRALVLLPLLAVATPAAATDATDPLWPCVQRFVPALSAAALWDGPPIEGADWRADPEVSGLVPRLLGADANTATADIRSFAAAVPEAERARRLTLLFAGLLDGVNERRAGMIAGIRRQAASVNAIADQLNDRLGQRGRMVAEGGSESSDEIHDLDTQIYWLQRVFDSRRKMQPYLCEEPVLAEQTFGALARAILNELP